MKTKPSKRLAPSARRRSSASASERGSAMFLMLIMAVVMATIMAGIYSYIGTTSKFEKRSNVRLEGTYAAEYAFEQAYQNLMTLTFSSGTTLPDVVATSGVTNLTTAPTTLFGTADGYTWQSYMTLPVENGVPVAAHSNFDPTSGVYKFMTVVEFTRTVPNMGKSVHMQFQREWDYSLVPLFQYAIFYNGNMELFPGAQFVVNGKVHTNGTLYTGTTASETFTDAVTYVNGISNQYSPSDPRAQQNLNGTISYATTPTVSSVANPPGASTANTANSNPNDDGPRELIEVPDVHSTDPNATDRMYDKAGLKVLVNSTATSSTSASGVAVPANSSVLLTSDGTAIPATDPLATYLTSMMSTGSMNDYRETTSLTTTDVDVSKVAAAYTAGGLPQTIPNATKWPNNSSVPAALKNQNIPAALRGKTLWNGILYVSDITNSTSHRAGVRLINGTNLPDGSNASSPTPGLTVVTDNAAYIVGDYNTGGAPAVDSGSNLSANNYASGYTVQPAAVMADAVTIVSSNWTGSSYNTKGTLSQRPAANTTINTALISGIVESTATGPNAAYSGGVENYLRLLEDWGGKRLTYYGSMINLYDSQQSTAKWITTGTYYNAPTRNWYFDVNFLNPNKLPPGTPVLRSLLRGQWVQVE